MSGFNLDFSAADCEEIRTGYRPGSKGLNLTFQPFDDRMDDRVNSPQFDMMIDWPSPPNSPLVPTAVIRVFTDGSCFNNGKKNSLGGMGIHFPDGELADVSLPYLGELPDVYKILYDDQRHVATMERAEKVGKVTNQRAELTAIYHALKLIDEHRRTFEAENGQNVRVEIHVYTDSKYSIDSLTNWSFGWKTNGWKTANGKPVKNRDILEPILALMKQGRWDRVVFFHAESHTNRDDERSRGNARADLLATQATRSQQGQQGQQGPTGQTTGRSSTGPGPGRAKKQRLVRRK